MDLNQCVCEKKPGSGAREEKEHIQRVLPATENREKWQNTSRLQNESMNCHHFNPTSPHIPKLVSLKVIQGIFNPVYSAHKSS